MHGQVHGRKSASVLHIDRPCRVWQRSDDAWRWHCCLCTSDVLPYTGTAPTWSRAYSDADHHVRTQHARTSQASTHQVRTRQTSTHQAGAAQASTHQVSSGRLPTTNGRTPARNGKASGLLPHLRGTATA